jgi:hypothetical protein
MTGAPVRGARITFTSLAGFKPYAASPPVQGLPEQTATSDSEGAFVIDGAGNSLGAVRVERSGFLASNESALLAAPRRQGEITIHLVPHSVIIVKVVDDHGDPVEGGRVVVLGRGGLGDAAGKWSSRKLGQTNDVGEFRASGLTGGAYLVAAGADRRYRSGRTPLGPQYELLPTYSPSTTDINSAREVVLAVGEQADATVKLQRGATYTIRGTMQNTPGRRVYIDAEPEGGPDLANLSPSASLAEDGTFEIAGATAGKYELMARNLGDMDSVLAGRGRAEVVHADVAGVVIAPTSAVTLNGTIRYETVELGGYFPLSQIRVFVRAEEPNLFSVGLPPPVGADGAFRIPNLSQGRYTLQLVPQPPGTYLKSMRLGDRVLAGSAIDLTAMPTPPAMEIVIGGNPGAVNATVEGFPDGAQTPLVALALAESPGRPKGSISLGRTDASGHAIVRFLPPGEYLIFAAPDLDPRIGLSTALRQQAERQAQHVQVNEGETVFLKVQPLGVELPAR